jgi:RecA-family ATPase
VNGLDPSVEAFANLLAGKQEEERKRIWQQARGLVTAQLPDEEVGKPPVRTLGEYLDWEIDRPPMIVHTDMVARGAVNAMIAKAGKGKTAVSLNRFVRWSMGKPFLDELDEVLYPEEPLKVLLIENEGSGWHFQRILRKIVDTQATDDEQRRLCEENLLIWGDGGWSGMKLDDPNRIATLRVAVERFRPDILFIEPMRGLWKGNENDSGEMANMIDSLSELANAYEMAVMLTHHERKGGAGDGGDPMDAARGSAVLVDLCAVVERWSPAAGGQHRELTWAKSRFGEPPAPIRLQWAPQRWGYDYVAEEAIVRSVARVLSTRPGEWLDMPAILEETAESRYKVSRALKTLEDDKRVRVMAHHGGRRYTWNTPDGGPDDDMLAVS